MQEKLEKEDYTDPACPFCTEQYQKTPSVRRIPISRVMEKLDSFFSVNDKKSAERHLLYWLEEAKAGRDGRGELTLRNELMGFYRKEGRKDEAILHATAAMELVQTLDLGETVTAATTDLNVATVKKAFGMASDALPLYEKAREIYESNLAPNDERLGGLYNNMALAYADLKRFEEARASYLRAIEVMKRQEHGEGEIAITWLNLADLIDAQKGENGAEEIANCLENAEKLLRCETLPENGNTAYIFEKCAPVFGYYGYFLMEAELKERSKRIYERA